MSGTTIRRNASTSALGFASCRGLAFRTGSAARHSGCGGPRLGNNGRAPPPAPAGWSRSRPLGLSERGHVWLRCSIDLGELERYHAAGRYDQPRRVGHRGAALRCGGCPEGAHPRPARPCPRLRLAMIIAGTGAPYALVAAEGLRFAPAYDGGALNPAVMPLFVALIGAIVLRERLSTPRKLGLLFILVGAVLVIGWHTETHGTTWDTSRTFGDTLFLLAAFLTAIFTVITQQEKLDPIHAAALVSTGSLIIWFPFYFTLSENHLSQIQLRDLAFQAIFQGVLVTIISLV